MVRTGSAKMSKAPSFPLKRVHGSTRECDMIKYWCEQKALGKQTGAGHLA